VGVEHDGGVEFDDLNDAERALWEAFPRRELVDRTDAGDCTVRANVVRALLLGARAADPGHLAVLTLVGARVVGTLDLSYADITCAVRMSRCRFDHQIEMVGTRGREFDLAWSHFPGLGCVPRKRPSTATFS